MATESTESKIWFDMVDSGACVHCPGRKTWTTSRQNNNSAGAPGTFGWLGYIESGSRLLYSVVLPGYRSLRTLINVYIPDSFLLFCNPHNSGDVLVSWLAGKPQSRWMLSAVTSTLSAKHNGTNQPPTQIRPIDYFTILPSLHGVELGG